MKHVFLLVMSISILLSCQKEQTKSVYHNESFSGSRDDNRTETHLVQSTQPEISSINYSGYVSSATPVPGTWYIKQNYQDAYQHFYQMDAKPDYPGNVLCGPTSYMLAAHMIVTAKGGTYPSSKAKLGAIYTKLSQAGKFDDALGMYISDVKWFSDTYDYPAVKTSYLRTTSRDMMKEYLEYYIKTGYPVVVTADIFGLQGAYWGNDIDMSDQPNVKYYVSKNGPVGHFILLIGIKINADGSGRVWYKDPLSKTSETRCASYTRILDAMKSNGNTDYYDAVAVFD
jgi:hypothetical protein